MTPLPITTAPSGSPAWHAARRTGIGSSDAPAACTGYYGENRVYRQLDPRRQPLDVYDAKVAQVETQAATDDTDDDEFAEDEPLAPNEDIFRGHLEEPIIVAMYRRRNGVDVQHPCGVFRHPELDWMLASPDGIIDGERGLECKSLRNYTTYKRIKDGGLAEVAPNWVVQTQHQMAVMNWREVVLAIKCGGYYLEETIQRHEGMIQAIIDREAELWDRIQRRDPPPFQPEHRRGAKTLRSFYGQQRKHAIRLGPNAVEAWERITTRKAAHAALDIEDNRDRAIVIAEIGEASAGVLGDGRAIERKLLKESIGLKERTDAGLDVLEPVEDTPQTRLKAVRLYLSQRGFLGIETTEERAEFLHIRTGKRLTAAIEKNEKYSFPEKPVICLYAGDVDPLSETQRILEAMGV